VSEEYMCPVCAETYADEEDMVNCCIADEFENFTCPICKTDYQHFAEAKECHEACEIKNHMAKLEAAGQQRLF